MACSWAFRFSACARCFAFFFAFLRIEPMNDLRLVSGVTLEPSPKRRAQTQSSVRIGMRSRETWRARALCSMRDDVFPGCCRRQAVLFRALHSCILTGRDASQLVQDLQSRRDGEASPETAKMVHGRLPPQMGSHAIPLRVPDIVRDDGPSRNEC